MSDQDFKNVNGVSFEVSFDIPTPKSNRYAAPPKSLQQTKPRKTEKEDIDAKLKKADEKRKLQAQQRLERIHERQEHCRKMATKMDLLLQQDAKRHGMPGTEGIPAMSRRQAANMIRSVTKDFKSIGCEVQGTIAEHDKLTTTS